MKGLTSNNLVSAACFYRIPNTNSSAIGGIGGFSPCEGSREIIPLEEGLGAMHRWMYSIILLEIWSRMAGHPEASQGRDFDEYCRFIN